MYLLLKTVLTGVVVVAVSEIGKRSSWVAAIIASLPLTSILAFVWLYLDTKDVEAVRRLSQGIFWMVVPSLLFFLFFSFFLKAGMNFYLALLLSSLLMAGSYAGYVVLLRRFGILI